MKKYLTFLSFFILSWAWTQETIYVSPEGGIYKDKPTLAPQEALDQALPGSTIVFLPGEYSGHFSLSKSGQVDKPIRILGSGQKAIFDGKIKGGETGAPAFFLSSVQWVEIENFSVKNYWPYFIRAKDCCYITFRTSYIEGAKRVFSASGEKSHHFLIEDNVWDQDPSGRMWSELSWEELHHGEYGHYNGALFAAKNILGSVIFRRNVIRHAYNGIRPTARGRKRDEGNLNFEVYENLFERIRDNPIEPEQIATNWWIHHNTIHNAHGWFSITNVAGSDIYIFSNIGWGDESYGLPGDHNAGRVFKFNKEGPFPDSIYVFHNSWYLRQNLIDHDYTTSLNHWNNAIHFQTISSLPKCTFLGRTKYQKGYSFDYDLCNFPFESGLTENSQERQGVEGNAHFLNPKEGDFRLAPESAAIDKGRVTSLVGWQSEFAGKAPDIGAFEGEKRFRGPTFRFWGNLYPERPRLVGFRVEPKQIQLSFSVPLKKENPEVLCTLIQEGKEYLLKGRVLGYHLTIDSSDLAFKKDRIEKIFLPLLVGENGLPLTLWASVSEKVERKD